MFFQQVVIFLGLAIGFAASQSSPIPPSQDPWYRAPPGFEASRPGTILRLRAAPGNLSSLYNNSNAAYHVLYRTTDSSYQPSWAVTTLFIPSRRVNSSVVSYQIPYNSPWINSGPSYTLYSPLFVSSTGGDIGALLKNGWFVNVPDHEGPLASFGSAVTSGHAILDGIRAVKSLNGTWAPSKDSRTALWGYSGGSLASEMATELQVEYAPELALAGAALGGTPANLTESLLASFNATKYSGVTPPVFLGLTKQHPDWNKTLIKSLKQDGPYNASFFLSANTELAPDVFGQFAFQDMTQYFKQGFGIYSDPTLKHALNTDTLLSYHGTPQIPLFIYHAINDELVPIPSTDALVSRYCAVGSNILYERNSIGDHAGEQVARAGAAVDWLRQLLGGSYSHTGCTVRNVTTNGTNPAA